MSNKEEISSVHIIDRSDPNEIIMQTKEGRKVTRLEELKEAIKGHRILRSDIALVNITTICPTCGAKTLWKQYAVYPTASGNPRGEGLKYLNRDQLESVRMMNRKLIESAKIYPEMRYYFSEHW